MNDTSRPPKDLTSSEKNKINDLQPYSFKHEQYFFYVKTITNISYIPLYQNHNRQRQWVGTNFQSNRTDYIY